MKNINQKNPCETVVGNDGNQVVNGCDERTGGYRRIHLQLFKYNWNDSSGNTRDRWYRPCSERANERN